MGKHVVPADVLCYSSKAHLPRGASDVNNKAKTATAAAAGVALVTAASRDPADLQKKEPCVTVTRLP